MLVELVVTSNLTENVNLLTSFIRSFPCGQQVILKVFKVWLRTLISPVHSISDRAISNNAAIVSTTIQTMPALLGFAFNRQKALKHGGVDYAI